MSQVSGQAGPSEMEDGEMREDDGGRLDGEDERSGYVSPAHNTAGGGPSVPQDNAGGASVSFRCDGSGYSASSRDRERKGRCQGETRIRLDAARRRQTKSRQRPWYRPCSSVTQS